ncbi:uncharacterized protein BCR38DRAFT_486327 [Pseudomassariella vexata]|uniref:Bacterial alpha-L-rhamnosidase N-terminal domain-containing protein n=1 Tax=Pseudomassariella vexata TaxID=1141098 RepID=A0A1Y2DS19_9PEZI|nr:uncharacterized protein BCR38DRAFT_486327 [Pseudomassariella vexata]ORY62053.1 hypothetical protein BCR38DRAFT_486327 [Pseudomassariella vexata]
MTPQPVVVTDLRFEHHPTGLSVPVVNGDSSILSVWSDHPLSSHEIASVRVKAHGISARQAGGTDGAAINMEWSAWKGVEAALLNREGWKGQFIASSKSTAVSEGSKKKDHFRPIRLWKTFKLDSEPKHARIYITALGVYEAHLNGQRIGDEHVAPGWIWNHHKLVTAQLGVYSPDVKATKPSARICSDETWKWKKSPIISSWIYDGRHVPRRRDWNDIAAQSPQASSWELIKTLTFPKSPSSLPPAQQSRSPSP